MKDEWVITKVQRDKLVTSLEERRDKLFKSSSHDPGWNRHVYLHELAGTVHFMDNNGGCRPTPPDKPGNHPCLCIRPNYDGTYTISRHKYNDCYRLLLERQKQERSSKLPISGG
jgi:hypothetical protein